MNTYYKIYPTAWTLKTTDEYQHGDTATIANKYGKETEVTIFKLVKEQNGVRLYSFIRKDNLNCQTYAQRKADKLKKWAESAEKKSNEAYEKSNEHRDFLVLGEPIKVGHHSEGRHRRIIAQAQNNMRKSCELADKAKEHRNKAERYEKRAKKIDLSMPESLEHYAKQLEKEIATHKFLKENPDKRPHSMALQYANKGVKTAKRQLEIAKMMWELEA